KNPSTPVTVTRTLTDAPVEPPGSRAIVPGGGAGVAAGNFATGPDDWGSWLPPPQAGRARNAKAIATIAADRRRGWSLSIDRTSSGSWAAQGGEGGHEREVRAVDLTVEVAIPGGEIARVPRALGERDRDRHHVDPIHQ